MNHLRLATSSSGLRLVEVRKLEPTIPLWFAWLVLGGLAVIVSLATPLIRLWASWGWMLE